MSIEEYLKTVRSKKESIGYIDSAFQTESMRNKGLSRTPEKRELLMNIQKRTKSSNNIVVSYF